MPPLQRAINNADDANPTPSVRQTTTTKGANFAASRYSTMLGATIASRSATIRGLGPPRLAGGNNTRRAGRNTARSPPSWANSRGADTNNRANKTTALLDSIAAANVHAERFSPAALIIKGINEYRTVAPARHAVATAARERSVIGVLCA